MSSFILDEAYIELKRGSLTEPLLSPAERSEYQAHDTLAESMDKADREAAEERAKFDHAVANTTVSSTVIRAHSASLPTTISAISRDCIDSFKAKYDYAAIYDNGMTDFSMQLGFVQIVINKTKEALEAVNMLVQANGDTELSHEQLFYDIANNFQSTVKGSDMRVTNVILHAFQKPEFQRSETEKASADKPSKLGWLNVFRYVLEGKADDFIASYLKPSIYDDASSASTGARTSTDSGAGAGDAVYTP